MLPLPLSTQNRRITTTSTGIELDTSELELQDMTERGIEGEAADEPLLPENSKRAGVRSGEVGEDAEQAAGEHGIDGLNHEEDERRLRADEHEEQGSPNDSASLFVWALTLSAGLSGLLFGYE